MADDPFDFLEETPLGGAPAQPETAQPEPQVAPAAEGGEQAKPPEPAAQPQESGPVPLATFLDVRDKEKSARRELEAAQKRIREFEESQQRPQPSFQDDPAGWEARQQQALRDVELKTTMALSGRFAADKHGEEKVRAAMDWGAQQNQADPTFGQRFIAQSDPYGWLVRQHQQDQTLSRMGGKTFEEAAREWASSNGFTAGAVQQPAAEPQAQAVPATPPPQAPPRSLASATPASEPAKRPMNEKDIAEGLFA